MVFEDTLVFISANEGYPIFLLMIFLSAEGIVFRRTFSSLFEASIALGSLAIVLLRFFPDLNSTGLSFFRRKTLFPSNLSTAILLVASFVYAGLLEREI